MNFWFRLAKFTLRNNFFITLAILVLSIAMAVMSTKNITSFKGRSLVPTSDSAFINYKDFIETFNIESNAVIIGLESKKLFTKENLNKIYSFDQELQKLPHVKSVLSLPSFQTIRREGDKFVVKPFMDKKIRKVSEIAPLKEQLSKELFYKDILFSLDKNIAFFVINIDTKIVDSKLRISLMADIKELTNKYLQNKNNEIHYSGLPHIRNENQISVNKEMILFLILCGIVNILLFYFIFRSWTIVTVCISIIVICVTWCLGIIALLGYPITILSFLIPTLIIVVSIPNFIFLINRYHKEFVSHQNKIKALSRAIEKVGNAMFFANITTALGFLALAASSTEILQEFAIAASVNIAMTFVIGILMLPISLSFLAPPKIKQTKHLENPAFLYLKKKVEFIIVKKRSKAIVFTITGIIFILAITGIQKIKITGNVLSDIKESSVLSKDLRFFESHLGGIIPLEVIIDTKRRNGALRNSTLKKIETFQEKLDKIEDLSAPISYINAIKSLKQAYYMGDPEMYSIPSRHEKNFIFSKLKRSSEMSNLSKNFIDEKKQKIRITLQAKDLNAKVVADLEKEIHTLFHSVFGENAKESVIVTGSSIYYTRGTLYLINSLFYSIAIAIVAITIILIFLFRSLKIALISLVPNVFSLIVTAGIMGYFNIPLKPSTILVFSVAFGICVDDTIHFLTKYKQQFIRKRVNISAGILGAIKEGGTSMMYTTTILFFGFGIFIFSEFGGTVSLGTLLCITVVTALFSNLLLLPSMLIMFDKPKVKKQTLIQKKVS